MPRLPMTIIGNSFPLTFILAFRAKLSGIRQPFEEVEATLHVGCCCVQTMKTSPRGAACLSGFQNTMVPNPCDFKNEIVPFLEGCIDPGKRGAIQSHLKDCESCRREVDTWGWIRRNCIGHREVSTEPDATLEVRRAPGSRKRSCQLCLMHELAIRSARPLRLISVLLLILIAAAAVGLWRLLPLPDTPSEIARDYRSIRSGTLHLERHAENPTDLDEFFFMRGVPFRTRVADLRDLHYRMVGGRVHQLINRRSVLYVYQGRSGELLLCEMFVGDMMDLARGGVLRECQNKKFMVCSDNEINLVFWQDGETTCVLASDIDSEELLQAALLEARAS